MLAFNFYKDDRRVVGATPLIRERNQLPDRAFAALFLGNRQHFFIKNMLIEPVRAEEETVPSLERNDGDIRDEFVETRSRDGAEDDISSRVKASIFW